MIIWLVLGCRQTLLSDADPTGAVERWDETLSAVVSEQGFVDYDLLEARRGDLDAYVAWLGRDEATKPPGRRAKKNTKVRNLRHAFWINAYNTLTLYQVLERSRPDSVLDVPGWLPKGGSGFFVETQFKVGTTFTSLSEIEHERLRMKELDYRDHAAMNCASTSCPPLKRGLYTARGIDDQLDAQMARWVADPDRGLRFEGDRLLVSPIFEWFARDFAFTSGGLDLCAVAAKHAEQPLGDRLIEASEAGCVHTAFPYDWSLNHRSAQENL